LSPGLHGWPSRRAPGGRVDTHSRKRGRFLAAAPPFPGADRRAYRLFDVEDRLLRLAGRAWNGELERSRPDWDERNRGRALVVEFDAVDPERADLDIVDHDLVDPDVAKELRTGDRELGGTVGLDVEAVILAGFEFVGGLRQRLRPNGNGDSKSAESFELEHHDPFFVHMD
jgi:hypothetical protein